MKPPRKDWTPQQLVEIWGLRQFGGLKDPTKVSSGGKASTDDETQVVFYVEQTPGFTWAKKVLSWKYAQYRDLAEFRITEPGQELTVKILADNGWGFLSYRTEIHRIGSIVHQRFLDALADRLREQPFTIVRDIEEEQAA